MAFKILIDVSFQLHFPVICVNMNKLKIIKPVSTCERVLLYVPVNLSSREMALFCFLVTVMKSLSKEAFGP